MEDLLRSFSHFPGFAILAVVLMLAWFILPQYRSVFQNFSRVMAFFVLIQYVFAIANSDLHLHAWDHLHAVKNNHSYDVFAFQVQLESWSFWLQEIVVLLTGIFCFLLIFHHIRMRFGMVLLATFLLGAVPYLHTFILIEVSSHRDYLPSSWSYGKSNHTDFWSWVVWLQVPLVFIIARLNYNRVS